MTNNMAPSIIEDTNLSLAWARAFIELMKPGCSELAPVIVRIRGFDGMPDEHDEIRSGLDRALRNQGEAVCQTVAGTIFPQSMWNPNLPNDAAALFDRYRKAWPGIKKCPQNRNGVYFWRLIHYEPKGAAEPINQLERLIQNYKEKGCHRRSALQANIIDPSRDLTASKVRGFPCLQQIGFLPHEGKLEVVAFYPMQYHFEKSYGNYLGLCRLGQFMAKQMGLRFTTLTCIASVLLRGDPPKRDLEPLADQVSDVLQNI